MTIGTFAWLDGHVERCELFGAVDGRGRRYVEWPDSVRVVDGASLFPPLAAGPVTVRRPGGWVDASRLTVTRPLAHLVDCRGECDADADARGES